MDALASYGVLDTGGDPAFDAITSLAAKLCGTPLAGVSLVAYDRQWSKSALGLAQEVPRQDSFCSDAVATSTALVVNDTLMDPRYRCNPLVTGDPFIRAYAGVPLVGREGLPLGALCVIDRRPRRFTTEQLDALDGLARQVVALLEQGRTDRARGLYGAAVLTDARDPVRLRRALEAGELVPHYQPIVQARSGRPHGFEALLRWHHPELGTLPPSAFLPGIADTALVVPVGRAVLDAALGQLANLRDRGASLPGGVSVNVTSGQLARPGLARDVLDALDRHQLPADQLALEITESTALPDEDLARSELGALADAGVSIVIDDFGVGWSNLSRVLALPVHALKLDRSIAGAVLTDPRAAAMVASTVRLATDLGLDLVAEGVETDAVRRHLVSAGCRWAQGWLFGAAVPSSSLRSSLRRLCDDADARPLASTG